MCVAMCMYVFILVLLHICAYLRVLMRIYACIRKFTRVTRYIALMYAYLLVYTWEKVNTISTKCAYIRAGKHLHTYVRIYAYMRIYTGK